MYPSRFRYEAPRSLAEAISLLADGDGEAKVLAGGQPAAQAPPRTESDPRDPH